MHENEMLRISLVVMIGLGIVIAGGAVAQDRPSADDANQSCITVEGDNTWIGRLNCLNRELERETKREQNTRNAGPSSLEAPGGAAPSEIGLYNQFGVQERLGDAYGKSAIPQRPPPPVYTSPLVK